MSTSRRATGVAALLVMVAGVTGCGSNQLFHDSTTAASHEGGSISVSQVNDAVTGIKAAYGASAASFDSSSAILFLLFADELQRVAARSGGAFSAAQARNVFMQLKVANPSDAAITALRSNNALGAIGRDPRSANQLNAFLKKASVQVNPRFGSWSTTRGVTAAQEPWIAAAKKS